MGGYDSAERKRKAEDLSPTNEVKKRKFKESVRLNDLIHDVTAATTNQACCVVVDGRVTVNNYMARGYVRPKTRVALLPYFEELDKYISEYFEHLMTGSLAGVLINEPHPSVCNYLSYLGRYTNFYGLRFTIEEATRLVKFLYLIFTKPDQYRETVYISGKLLEYIIGDSRLSYKDLTLDWRPVFRLYYEVRYGKHENVDYEKIQGAVYKLKKLYPLEASKEIWDEIQVYLSPRNDDKKFFDLCLRFLPVIMTAEEHIKFGAGLWWDDLWRLYELVEMGAVWGEDLPYLFSTLFRFCPNFRNISHLYENLFTRILRSMQLVVRQGKVSVGDGTGTASILAFAGWVGDLIGGPNSCQPHLDRLMKCLETFMHPSTCDEYSKAILVFMNRLSERVRDRFYEERLKKHKRDVPEEYYLNDDDVSHFVDCMLQTTLTAIYNELSFDKFSISKILMGLAALKPEVVIPKFLEHTYPALNAVCEPHRLLNTLECLVEVVYQIAADDNPRTFKDPLDVWMEQDEMISRYYPFVEEHKKKHFSDQARTSRSHLIYLLDALSTAIDINDVAKTALALQNINLIFFLVPNVDCTPCLELRDDLTEDEKILCQLTARLPALSASILEKILAIIESLSVCAPKNSTENLGGLKDESTAIGDEEKTLRKSIDCCINALLCNSSPDIARQLIDTIFDFVTRNQFDSAIGTELITGVVAQSVFVRPENLPRFAQYVLKNLKLLLTPEMRREKNLQPNSLWFVNLASSLFCTTSEAFVKNKEICYELIGLLLDCECKFAHDIGCQGLWYSLYMLLRIYTIEQQVLGDQFGRSLKEWVPIRDWGVVYQEHEVSMAWHVPDESRKNTVTEILNLFMFPLIEKMKTEKISTHDLRRYLKQVNMAYCGAVTCLPVPESGKSGALNVADRILPSARFSNTHITNKFWDIPYTDGSNVREVILSTLEGLLAKMDFKRGEEDSQALISMVNMLRNIIDDKAIDVGERNGVTNQTEYIFTYLNDPCLMGKRITINAFDSYLFKNHLEFVTNEDTLNYYPFQRRVFSFLVKLALNDYPDVQVTTRSELNNLLAIYNESRSDVIELLAEVLLDKNSSLEKIKAALEIIRDNKWTYMSTIEEKIILWPALVRIRVAERPTFNKVFEEIFLQIQNMKMIERAETEDETLLEFAQEWYNELPKKGVWSNFSTKEQLEVARQKRKEKLICNEEQRAILVEKLLELYYDKDLHHLRNKLARAMLWKCQRVRANTITIKILLSKLICDDILVRDRCADELAYWLRKNKPKTKRIDWVCPETPKNEENPLICGLRKDNVCAAYDSHNLPVTTEKWQNTIFISKQAGCHKWPKTLSVCAPEPSVDRGALSDAEEAVVTFFENEDNIKSMVESLCLEKEENAAIDENIYRLFKYVLRNFPNHTKILNNLVAALTGLLFSKKHTDQRAAADIFFGLAKGTRHYSFEVLDKMWKTVAPAIDFLIDHLNSEAENAWISVVPMVFYHEDPRRFHWLIETIIAGMQRPAPSAYHQTARISLIPAKNWRDIEIRKRITDIAWKQLPTAMMEMQRVGISHALRVISTVEDANLFNDFEGLPERFQLKGTDYWLEKFTEKIESLVATPSSTRSEPQTSSHTMDIELQAALQQVLEESKIGGEIDIAGMRTLLSESNLQLLDEDDDRQGRIFLLCCLEFLLQYYEECMTCLTPGIVKLIPILLEYSNDDESSDLHTFKDHDIISNASVLIHDYMSGLFVNETFADSLLSVLIDAYDRTCLWRAKVSVLKFFQVIVFSNVYVYERGNRPQIVANLVYNGLADEQIEVRQEAARCLETLIHFAYIKLDDELMERMKNMLVQECRWRQHGAILGFASIVAAHPFTTPPLVVPAIQIICQNSGRNAQIQDVATKVLREFRSSHRDTWNSTCKTIGPDLAYQIQNVIAPVYYA